MAQQQQQPMPVNDPSDPSHPAGGGGGGGMNAMNVAPFRIEYDSYGFPKIGLRGGGTGGPLSPPQPPAPIESTLEKTEQQPEEMPVADSSASVATTTISEEVVQVVVQNEADLVTDKAVEEEPQVDPLAVATTQIAQEAEVVIEDVQHETVEMVEVTEAAELEIISSTPLASPRASPLVQLLPPPTAATEPAVIVEEVNCDPAVVTEPIAPLIIPSINLESMDTGLVEEMIKEDSMVFHHEEPILPVSESESSTFSSVLVEPTPLVPTPPPPQISAPDSAVSSPKEEPVLALTLTPSLSSDSDPTLVPDQVPDQFLADPIPVTPVFEEEEPEPEPEPEPPVPVSVPVPVSIPAPVQVPPPAVSTPPVHPANPVSTISVRIPAPPQTTRPVAPAADNPTLVTLNPIVSSSAPVSVVSTAAGQPTTSVAPAIPITLTKESPSSTSSPVVVVSSSAPMTTVVLQSNTAPTAILVRAPISTAVRLTPFIQRSVPTLTPSSNPPPAPESSPKVQPQQTAMPTGAVKVEKAEQEMTEPDSQQPAAEESSNPFLAQQQQQVRFNYSLIWTMSNWNSLSFFSTYRMRC